MASVSVRQSPISTNRSLSTSFLRIDTGTAYSPDLELKFLDEIASELKSNVNSSELAQGTIRRLFVECNRLRHHLPSDEWKSCVDRIRQSEVLSLVHQDAFTHRAFSKPRAYAGDAVMMDLIYGQEEGWEPPEMSAIGKEVFKYTTSAAASAGVRARREHIAELLDNTLPHTIDCEVLAVASGHLREASMSSAVRRRRFSRFVALDADSKSLQEVQNSYGRFGVCTHLADIRKMLTGNLDLGSFDVIYSTGLYDYLSAKMAQRLTYHLFSMLHPGGKLVIANFLPTIEDIGYMEACMDWFLVYRDRFEMMELTRFIQLELIGDIRVSTEENQNIIFLELTRA